jgi:DNA-binding NarL/FixJ family response regulator
MTISVLIADDQALIRSGFHMMLNGTADIRIVGEATNGLDAASQAVRLDPDVVLMDVRMPGMDGIEATKRIVAETRSRVLILTTFDLDEYAFEGLRAGASGFLLKDVLPAALYDAIRAVAAGDAALTPRITRDLVNRYAREPGPIKPDKTHSLATLSPRELEVFNLVATGLTNAEISRHLFLTEATVKTHITRVLSKLHLRDRVQVVIYSYEKGLR